MDTMQETNPMNKAVVKEQLSYGKERMERVAEEARKRGQAVMDDSADWVRKYPVQAIGIAVLTGAAIGALAWRFALAPEDNVEGTVKRYIDGAENVWGKLKDGIEEALCSARKALD